MRLLSILALAAIFIIFMAATIMVLSISCTQSLKIAWLFLMWGYYIFMAYIILKNVKSLQAAHDEAMQDFERIAGAAAQSEIKSFKERG